MSGDARQPLKSSQRFVPSTVSLQRYEQQSLSRVQISAIGLHPPRNSQRFVDGLVLAMRRQALEQHSEFVLHISPMTSHT
jgi:hypothetical protein